VAGFCHGDYLVVCFRRSVVKDRRKTAGEQPVFRHRALVTCRPPRCSVVAILYRNCSVEQSRSHGEVVLAKKPFATFPLHLADRWEGRELGLDQATLDVLKLSDYMMRVYKPLIESLPPSDSSPRSLHAQIPAWLYVGYYQSQRTGATYHSPQNCLPGAGWQFVESTHVPISVGTSVVTINQVVIQKGLDKQVILYWYHDRGRVIASEYWAKAYLLWDAATRNRTDGRSFAFPSLW
jgi:hypothetical protein